MNRKINNCKLICEVAGVVIGIILAYFFSNRSGASVITVGKVGVVMYLQTRLLVWLGRSTI
jgi:hypothetical protein